MKKLQNAFDNLRKSRRKTRKAISKINKSVVEEFLGEYDTPKRRLNLSKYGCGHILYGAPGSTHELVAADAVVLFAMTSPLLGPATDFNPTRRLETMRYWREGKGLRKQVRSTQGRRKYSLHFMSWQQVCEVHGKCDKHALNNRELLVAGNPALESIIERENNASQEFVNQYTEWLCKHEKPIVLITNSPRKQFDKLISNLLDNDEVIRIKAGLRAPKNYQIMGRIRDKLP